MERVRGGRGGVPGILYWYIDQARASTLNHLPGNRFRQNLRCCHFLAAMCFTLENNIRPGDIGTIKYDGDLESDLIGGVVRRLVRIESIDVSFEFVKFIE